MSFVKQQPQTNGRVEDDVQMEPVAPPLPPYFVSPTSRPVDLPTAYLNGAQDMISLFGLVPIYDRSVKPYYNQNTSSATDATSKQIPETVTPTPRLQLNRIGGPPTFSFSTETPLTTTAAALSSSSQQQQQNSNSSSSIAVIPKKPTKPPPTYAHYVQDLAGRVNPPRKSIRAQKVDKGVTLSSILNKPEYTPQTIVPFDRETIESSFSVQSGDVPEIDQSLLEPDEEQVPKKKKKKKDRDRIATSISTATTNM